MLEQLGKEGSQVASIDAGAVAGNEADVVIAAAILVPL